MPDPRPLQATRADGDGQTPFLDSVDDATVPSRVDGPAAAFDIAFPADLAQGRYELIGRAGTTGQRAFGAGWSLPTSCF